MQARQLSLFLLFTYSKNLTLSRLQFYASFINPLPQLWMSGFWNDDYGKRKGSIFKHFNNKCRNILNILILTKLHFNRVGENSQFPEKHVFAQ